MPNNIDGGVDQGIDQGISQYPAPGGAGSQTNQEPTMGPVDWNISGGIDQGIDQYGASTQGGVPGGTTSPQVVGPLSIVPLTSIGLSNASFSWNAGDTQPAVRFKVMDDGAGELVDAGTEGVTCTVDFIVPGQPTVFDTLPATSTDGIAWTAIRLPTDSITFTSGRYFMVAKFVYGDRTQFSAPDSGAPAVVMVYQGF